MIRHFAKVQTTVSFIFSKHFIIYDFSFDINKGDCENLKKMEIKIYLNSLIDFVIQLYVYMDFIYYVIKKVVCSNIDYMIDISAHYYIFI